MLENVHGQIHQNNAEFSESNTKCDSNSHFCIEIVRVVIVAENLMLLIKKSTTQRNTFKCNSLMNLFF